MCVCVCVYVCVYVCMYVCVNITNSVGLFWNIYLSKVMYSSAEHDHDNDAQLHTMPEEYDV